ncbi:alpha/beta fold hydrolase [Streptomyces sp. WMMC897]|uniref:alpha/beta fold hydrolase n=1 Tax=Streptomyces sp. WMMC897 TaxID=3014782 RepID=UPI0022B645F5|nr:alpha/beta fold hydrolase [Streptomyces sp. WMMC897]MCZ7414519.1 alpha/beta fold hydrolase [Streptomyces sp. WMMC897]
MRKVIPVVTAFGAEERLLGDVAITERELRCAHVRTAVLAGGEGPPVVLLHGAGEFAARWFGVIPALAGSHRVVAPDLPGHGSSGAADGRLDADRTTRWLDELIAQTCAEPPTVVGHLLGGAVAARFAAAHPDRLARLVLVDSYGLTPFRPEPAFALALAGFVARPTERSRDRLFRQCVVEPDRLRDELGAAMTAFETHVLATARRRRQKAALRGLFTRLALPAIPEADLARIAVPTSLVWGREDRQARLRGAEAAHERYGWPLHIIEDSGADPALERLEAFLTALRAALAEGGGRP